MNATQRRAAQLLDDLVHDMNATCDLEGKKVPLWPQIRDHIINLEERDLHSAFVLGRMEREVLMKLEEIAESELPAPYQREALEAKARYEEQQWEMRQEAA